MITKRRLALLTSLTASPLFAAPFLAIGDNAELFVTANAQARFEDNVTFSSSNQIEDEVFEFTPGVELLFGKNSLTTGSLVLQESFVAYSDNSDLDSDLFSVALRTSYQGAKLSLSSDASFRQLNQNTRDVRSASVLNRRDSITAGVNGEYAVTEKSKIGSGISYSETSYKRDAFSDQENYSVPVNYYFAIAPKLDLSAGMSYRKTEVETANADSEDYYFNVGARGEFTPKLSGNFTVGYTTRESDGASSNDDSTIGLDAGLTYTLTEKTSFSLNLGRDFETGADAQGTETSSIGLGVTTSLTPQIALSANANYSLYDYLSSSREDNYLTLGLGASYTYSPNLSFNAAYAYDNNDSDLAGANFVANVVSIGASFRY
jgi:hypothetical protein